MGDAGIYTILSPTNKVYVGQSHQLKIRERQYILRGAESQQVLCRSIKKYGWDNHKFKVMIHLADNVPQTTMDFWEQYLMDHYRAYGCELLNIREAGSGGKLAESTKIKIGIGNTGKKRTKATKVKISEIKKELFSDPRNHPMWGKPRPESSRKKMSLTRSTMVGSKNPKSKPLFQLTLSGILVNEWASVSTVHRELGFDISSIAKCCRGEKKTCGGFLWQYKK